MNPPQQRRRRFLFSLSALGIGRLLAQSASSPRVSAQAGVLSPGEGEHLVHFRDHGNIFIKAGRATGSENLAFGTQQVIAGSGIPTHRHFEMDEAFYVLEGGGTFLLNDEPRPFERGSTIFIPRNNWHAFQNPDRELLLLCSTGSSARPAIRPACRQSSSLTHR